MGTWGIAQESSIQYSKNVKYGHNDKKWAKNVAELGKNGNSIIQNKSAQKFHIYSQLLFVNFQFWIWVTKYAEVFVQLYICIQCIEDFLYS